MPPACKRFQGLCTIASNLSAAATTASFRHRSSATHALRSTSTGSDPSLVLHTSAGLGDKKVEFMKACSKAIASCLSKPESYVSVCVHDDAAVIWAGDETPCALGVVCSIGQINQENNAALTAAISELIEPFGVPSNRIYLNVRSPPVPGLAYAPLVCAHVQCLLSAQFFDVPRANCGWSGRTFAG